MAQPILPAPACLHHFCTSFFTLACVPVPLVPAPMTTTTHLGVEMFKVGDESCMGTPHVQNRLRSQGLGGRLRKHLGRALVFTPHARICILFLPQPLAGARRGAWCWSLGRALRRFR